MNRRHRRLVFTLSLLLGAAGPARAVTQTIHAPVPMTGDGFGAALAVVNDVLLVGAPGTSVDGLGGAGAAYLFDSTTGVLRLTLHAPFPSAGAGFGGTVAIAGGYAVVGAGTPSGVIYLFFPATGAFVLRIAADGSAVLGPALAADGPNLLLVGLERAFGQDGAADLLFFNGVLFRHLFPPATNSDALFGSSVATVGTRVVVGARGAIQGRFIDAGAAYVFDGTNGASLVTLSSPSPTTNGAFGTRATALGSDVVVSAPNDARGAIAGGAAYRFDTTSGALRQIYVPSIAIAGSGFGVGLAAVGTNLVVGSPGYPLVGLANAGFAYLFDGATGSLIRTFQSPAPVSAGRFGIAVAVAGGDVLIAESGALAGDPTLSGSFVTPVATNAGAVHRFSPEAVHGGTIISIPPTAPGSPTPPFSCVSTPIVTSLTCRVGGVVGFVRARRGGPTKAALLRSLVRAETALRAADGTGLSARRRRALLARAHRNLDGFTARLDTRAGLRFLPPRLQTPIFAVVIPLMDELATLQAAG